LRVGLLGGTFDPVHNAHLQIAEAARSLCGLDEVIFIPAFVPPHKSSHDITPFSDRANMIQLAINGRSGLKLSTIESHLPAPSYTIDTLRHFQSVNHDAELYFIIGSDAFLDVTTWKAYRQVLAAVHFIILGRAGCDGRYTEELIKGLGYKQEESSPVSLRHWYHPSFAKKIFFPCVPSPLISDVSSSQIRQDIRDNLSVTEAIPGPVLDYICKYRLYG
jgi:nicotinate-nucleotide adenylyltransferase